MGTLIKLNSVRFSSPTEPHSTIQIGINLHSETVRLRARHCRTLSSSFEAPRTESIDALHHEGLVTLVDADCIQKASWRGPDPLRYVHREHHAKEA